MKVDWSFAQGWEEWGLERLIAWWQQKLKKDSTSRRRRAGTGRQRFTQSTLVGMWRRGAAGAGVIGSVGTESTGGSRIWANERLRGESGD